MFGSESQNLDRVIELIPLLQIPELSDFFLKKLMDQLTPRCLGQKVLHPPMDPPLHCSLRVRVPVLLARKQSRHNVRSTS
jgi:hypothetical protein